MQLLSAPLRVDEWGLPGGVLDEEDPVRTSVFDEDEDDALYLAPPADDSMAAEDRAARQADEARAADARATGRVVSYGSEFRLFGWPAAGLEGPTASTQLTVHRTPAGATEAVRRHGARALDIPGGTTFAVPGVPGAIGVRTNGESAADPDWEYDPTFEWFVYFPHGATEARVRMAMTLPVAPAVNPGQRARAREAALPLRDVAQAAVVAVSQRYAAHLDDVLGD